MSLVIGGRHLDELRAEPGQFFRWRFLTRDLWWTSAPYSLSAPPRGDRLRITVKAAGDHSRALLAAAGRATWTEARVHRRDPPERCAATARRLLIAGGAGITPLRALLESLPAAPGDLTLIYRVSSMRDAMFRRELEQLAAARQAKVWFVIDAPRAEARRDPLVAQETRRGVTASADPGHDGLLVRPPEPARPITRELRGGHPASGRSTTSRSSSDLHFNEGTRGSRVILAIVTTAAALATPAFLQDAHAVCRSRHFPGRGPGQPDARRDRR